MTTETIDIAGVLGGKNSQLALLLPGYDPDDYQAVRWIRMKSPELGSVEQTFGTDDGGHPIVMRMNANVTLQRSQIKKAEDNGAILTLGARWGNKVRIGLYEVVLISDSGKATVFRAITEPIIFADSAIRSAYARTRTSNDSFSVSERIMTFYPARPSQLGTKRSQPGSLFNQIGVV